MEQETQQTIQKIRDLLLSTQRPGIERLVTYLENESDFYTAPASTDFHGNDDGELAKHSLRVYELLEEKVRRYGLPVPPPSIVLCGLMHDVCKTNFYKRAKKSVIDDKKPYITKSFPKTQDPKTGMVTEWAEKQVKNWVDKEVWEVDDKFPIGHGEKSVIVLQRYIQLNDEEAIAIRWHMVAFDPGIHFNYPSGYPFRKAMQENKLLTLLYTADMEASNILEGVEEKNKKI